MKRRSFITFLGGAAAAWPLAARAQQRPAMPVIGDLSSTSSDQFADLDAAFRQGLSEIGYTESQNVAIERRWADGQYDRLPALAAELVRRQVAVIFAEGTTVTLAAKAATSTIPIVFVTGVDSVRVGLVARVNRPGGNVTGVEIIVSRLGAKRLGHELVPNARAIALLVNPDNAAASPERIEVEEASRTIGKQIVVVSARSERDLDTAFATLVEQRVGGLLVGGDPFFDSVLRNQLIALSVRHSIPTIYAQREFAASGGLMS